MGRTDSKISEGLTQKHDKKRTESKIWKDWLKKMWKLTWKYMKDWLEKSEGQQKSVKYWLSKWEGLALNTGGLSLNKKVLLTPQSHCNFLKLFTFRNILIEHFLLKELVLIKRNFHLLISFVWTFLYTLFKRKYAYYITSNFILYHLIFDKNVLK